jgi:PPP family 3-phenylpropionic acid transporter
VALAGIVLQRVAENQTTAWFGAYWIAQGRGTTEAGFLNAWSVFSEFVAMGLTTGWLARVDLRAAMMWSCLISAIRWGLTPFCGELWCAIPLQSVHALSFGVFYPASLLWIRTQWPTTFFNTRYLMEGSVRVASSGYYYLAAGTLIPLMGYVPVFEGCAVMAALGALVWWLPGFGRTTETRDRRF